MYHVDVSVRFVAAITVSLRFCVDHSIFCTFYNAGL